MKESVLFSVHFNPQHIFLPFSMLNDDIFGFLEHIHVEKWHKMRITSLIKYNKLTFFTLHKEYELKLLYTYEWKEENGVTQIKHKLKFYLISLFLYKNMLCCMLCHYANDIFLHLLSSSLLYINFIVGGSF